MAGVHGQTMSEAGTAHHHDNAIRAHAQRVLHRVAHGHFVLAATAGGDELASIARSCAAVGVIAVHQTMFSMIDVA